MSSSEIEDSHIYKPYNSNYVSRLSADGGDGTCPLPDTEVERKQRKHPPGPRFPHANITHHDDGGFKMAFGVRMKCRGGGAGRRAGTEPFEDSALLWSQQSQRLPGRPSAPHPDV